MTLEAKKPEITNETYLTAGAGTVVGGIGAKAVINKRLNSVAGKTVKALNSSKEECDTFMKKHARLVTNAVDSKKGFFGKVNKFVAKSGEEYTDDLIDTAAGETLGGYWKKAAGKLSQKFSGEELQTKTETLRNKFLQKDIFKSYKNATAGKNALITAGAALAGLFGACILREAAKANTAKKEPVKSVH